MGAYPPSTVDKLNTFKAFLISAVSLIRTVQL